MLDECHSLWPVNSLSLRVRTTVWNDVLNFPIKDYGLPGKNYLLNRAYTFSNGIMYNFQNTWLCNSNNKKILEYWNETFDHDINLKGKQDIFSKHYRHAC